MKKDSKTKANGGRERLRQREREREDGFLISDSNLGPSNRMSTVDYDRLYPQPKALNDRCIITVIVLPTQTFGTSSYVTNHSKTMKVTLNKILCPVSQILQNGIQFSITPSSILSQESTTTTTTTTTNETKN